MWQFLLGLFIGSFVGFLVCAVGITASRADRIAEHDYETKIKKKEETHDDGKPVSEVGFEDF